MEYILTSSDTKIGSNLSSERHVNVKSPYHINPEMEFIITLKGCVTMCISNREYDVKEGFGCFVMPFEPHSFSTKCYNECHVLMFSSHIIKYFFDFLACNRTNTRCFPIPDELIRITDKFLPNNKNNTDTVEALACIAPICAQIKASCNFVKGQNQYDDIFLKALAIINEDFTTGITLSEVAKRIGINHATLSRKFSQNALVSFNTYVNYLRCRYAAIQITETESTFTEIALISGFGTIRSFNRIFQKYMRCTPTEYRSNPFEISSRIKI